MKKENVPKVTKQHRPRAEEAAEETRRLKAAVAEALEQCWEGRLPLRVLEEALLIRKAG